MTEAICLRCAHYDDRPDLAGDLPETYGLCRWQPAIIAPSALGCLRWSVGRALESKSDRMIPKRGLADRPDLWATCDTFAERGGMRDE